MKTFSKIFFSAIIFFGLFALAGTSRAATYYISPTGSGTTCSNETPCNIQYCINTKMSAGDTCYLKDGTYTGASNMLTVTTSGTAGSPKTIKAENDGMVTVDGQNARKPCLISGVSYINIEGIICRNSGPDNYIGNHVFQISNSSHISVRRVSAYDAAEGNNSQFLVYYSSHILLEDCAAAGYGRDAYNFYGSNYVTARRCWLRHENMSADGSGLVNYHTENSIIENCVIFQPNTHSYWVHGIGTHSNDFDKGDNNKYYGNVVAGSLNRTYFGYKVTSRTNFYPHTGNEFHNNVSINSTYAGFKQEADDNMVARNFTIVNENVSTTSYGVFCQEFGGNNTIAGLFKNSVVINQGHGIYVKNDPDHTITNQYNNYYGCVSTYGGKAVAGTGETYINPAYDTATYGNGVYLMVPAALKGKGENGADIGAKVLYRYVDGSLTGTALWPWPMEDRIMAETGFSVTYETGGGLWKTLDGVYSDTTPPASPTGLTVL